MEQKRELNLEEMDKVSGGSTTQQPSVSTGTCPSCGMPVPSSAGITGAECPHCHRPIPVEPRQDINH